MNDKNVMLIEVLTKVRKIRNKVYDKISNPVEDLQELTKSWKNTRKQVIKQHSLFKDEFEQNFKSLVDKIA